MSRVMKKMRKQAENEERKEMCAQCEEVDEETFIKLLAALDQREMMDALLVIEIAGHCLCVKIHPRKYWLRKVMEYKVEKMDKEFKRSKEKGG